MNKKAKRIIDYYNSDKIYLWEWILVGVVGLLVFCSVVYGDMKSLTVWSTNVWDVTVDSNIFHLYEYTAQNIYGVRHQYMGSELMSVLPWSLWNLPIWIAQRFFGVVIVNSPLSLAWSKLFLVVLSLLMLYYAYKICMFITEDRTKSLWCVFFTSSSFLLYLGVLYTGQNDILMVTASVIAIHGLIIGKNKSFLAWSALAISIKPFYLFAFLAVIVLKEKNVIKIFLKALIAISGLVLQKIIFHSAPMYKESLGHGPSSDMFEKMFPANIKTSFGGISFFAVAFVLIIFYAYSRHFSGVDAKSSKLFSKYVIYSIVLTYLSYLMFSPFSFYRVILLVPFLYIMMFSSNKHLGYSMIIETVMLAALAMQILLRGSNFCRVLDVNGSIFQALMGYSIIPETASYPDLVTPLIAKITMLEDLRIVFPSVALISGLIIIALNHPEKHISLPYKMDKRCTRALTLIRPFIIVPFILALLMLFTTDTGRI